MLQKEPLLEDLIFNMGKFLKKKGINKEKNKEKQEQKQKLLGLLRFKLS